MITSSEILEQARKLSIDERLVLSVQMAEEAAGEQAQRLSASEREHIDGVLSSRVDDECEPLPSEEEFMKRVRAKAAETRPHA